MKSKLLNLLTNKAFLIILTLALLVPNFINIQLAPRPVYNQVEAFDPNLSYLTTLPLLDSYVDSVARARSINGYENLAYTETLADILRKRFYHGFSIFSLKENWIAALAGKLIWYDLACKVLPEDIIKEPFAGCSQQSIVMMAILREKGIAYSPMLFAHHYALEAELNNKWYYFDVNLEPTIKGDQRLVDHFKNSADSLKRYYDPLKHPNLNYQFGVNKPLHPGTINEIPAVKARIFQSVTGILSKILWLIPFCVLIYTIRKKRSA